MCKRKKKAPAKPKPEDDRVCRICFGEAEPGCPLVRKCACRGSAAWVHNNCLSQWRRTSDKVDAAYRCGECKEEFCDPLTLKLLEERLAQQRAEFGDRDEQTLFTIHVLGREYYSQAKYAAAEPLFREVLEGRRETLGERDEDTLVSMGNLGALLHGKFNLSGTRAENGGNTDSTGPTLKWVSGVLTLSEWFGGVVRCF